MRMAYFAVLVATAAPALAVASPVQTASAQAAAATAGYNSADTDLGTLLDDPAAKAVLVKHIPDVVKSEQIDMARSLTLKLLQSYAGDKLTDETLAKIDADLAKLPVKK